MGPSNPFNLVIFLRRFLLMLMSNRKRCLCGPEVITQHRFGGWEISHVLTEDFGTFDDLFLMTD